MFITVSATGETHIPMEFLHELGIENGAEFKLIPDGNGGAYLMPVQDIRSIRGIFQGRGPAMTIEDIDEAIAEAVTTRYKATNSER